MNIGGWDIDVGVDIGTLLSVSGAVGLFLWQASRSRIKSVRQNLMTSVTEHFARGGCGNLNSRDKWFFCATAA